MQWGRPLAPASKGRRITLDDTLIRIVLVGTTSVPAFALGFWAGAHSRAWRRPWQADLPTGLSARGPVGGVAAGEAGGQDASTDGEPDAGLGAVTPLRPEMEGRGSRTPPPT